MAYETQCSGTGVLVPCKAREWHPHDGGISRANAILNLCKAIPKRGLQAKLHSTTAILLTSDSGIHSRPLASRDMLRTDELGAGIG